MSTVALVIATVIPLLVLYLIFSRDLYGTGTFRYVFISFLWGGFAFLIAAFINSQTIQNNWADIQTVRQFTAPVAEEILKGLFLIYLVRRPQFTYFVDGAIYGFAVGIGFAVFENYEYILNNQSAAMVIAIGRVISTNLIHGAASSIVGIAFGLSRFERAIGKWRIILIGLFVAMILHIGFNNLVTRVSSEWLLVYAAIIGFSSFGLIWWAIQKGLAEEKEWIKETLGDADRVTSGEAKVVQNLANINIILSPLAERFGDKKASEIEKFLVLQARLGILRKTLDKLQDEKLKISTLAEMETIRTDMDQARVSVGTFTMMYLRGIFPDDDDTLWGHFEDTISQRISEMPKDSGGGLWASLDKRAAVKDKTPDVDELQ